MTKTEKRRLKNKAALKALIMNFGIYNIDESEGGRKFFNVDTLGGDVLRGEFMRNTFDVNLVESIKLSGDGFTPSEHRIQKAAVKLEEQMDEVAKRAASKIE